MRIEGRATRLRRIGGNRWEAEALTADGAPRRVAARAAVLATGVGAERLVPPGMQLSCGLGARLSRMRVLRGALPRAAAIVPSRSAGGLFFASREVPGSSGRERVWLVSDGFSSPGVVSPGALTDGWWTCSVLERLQGFIAP